MRLSLVILVLLLFVIASVSFTEKAGENPRSLRNLYSQSPDKWPPPFVDSGITWKELGILPPSPLEPYKDSLKHLIELGKTLFFDQRVSGSGKISCASCHQPELSWTDGISRSVGHEGAKNKRNSLSIQNVWFYNKLFWDGRSRDLEDQAFAPINSESEMHADMRELPFKLKKIKGYAALFDSAYGDPAVNPDRIAGALATFQRTIVSRPGRFDAFLKGRKNALTNSQLRGLHLFRTKARCMNCHHGPLFSDNQFHNVGFPTNENTQDDPGLYNITHKNADIGKFRTPILRDVMKTGPWMHHGQTHHMMDILVAYNKGSAGPHEKLIRPLNLDSRELADLLAFLESISSDPVPFNKPKLPEP